MWPFRGKPQSYLGVDLGAGGVKVVELKLDKHRPVLFTYGLTSGDHNIHKLLVRKEASAEELPGASPQQEPMPKEDTLTIDEKYIGHYAEVLRIVCREIKAVSKTAVASLPVSAVFHAIVTLPPLPKEEFQSVLKAELKKLLPLPLEEMAVDSQVVVGGGTEGNPQRVLVNAVPRALVVFYTKVFQQAGLKLDSLEPESTALARALVGRDPATTMLIDMGAERTNFFIIDQTVPATHHSIKLGGERITQMLQSALGAERAEAERMKHDLFDYMPTAGSAATLSKEQFLNLLMSIIEPVAKEIEYSFELFLRQSGNEGKRSEKVVLTGGAAHLPYLPSYIADKFKLKCYLGDPWGRVVYQERLRPLLSAIGPRLAVAIGLALRNMV